MGLILRVIDKNRTEAKKIDIIRQQDVDNYTAPSRTLLNYIDPYDNSYFNRKQVILILAEISSFSQTSLYNQTYIKTIEKAAHYFLLHPEYSFLWIAGE